MLLDQEFGIAVRAGLHCAPLMHRVMGTFVKGGNRPGKSGVFHYLGGGGKDAGGNSADCGVEMFQRLE